MSYDFNGSVTKSLSPSVEEYRGMSLPQVHGALLDTLRSIAPDVSFFDDDVCHAAWDLWRRVGSVGDLWKKTLTTSK